MPAKKAKTRSKAKKTSTARRKKPKSLAAHLVNHRLKIYFTSLSLVVVFTIGLTIQSIAALPGWKNIPNPPRGPGGSLSGGEIGPQNVENCKKILVIGDSIARGTASIKASARDQDGGRLERQLSQLGYCSQVINRGFSGSAASQWTTQLPSLISVYQPDFVVAHFLGNQTIVGSPKWTDKGNAWWIANTNALRTINAQADAAGVPIYWIIPAPAYYHCSPSLYVTALYRSFAKWQINNLPKERQINFRDNWGGNVYTTSFRASSGLPMVLRTNRYSNGFKDCLHFTDLGYNFMANGVRSKVYVEWQK